MDLLDARVAVVAQKTGQRLQWWEQQLMRVGATLTPNINSNTDMVVAAPEIVHTKPVKKILAAQQQQIPIWSPQQAVQEMAAATALPLEPVTFVQQTPLFDDEAVYTFTQEKHYVSYIQVPQTFIVMTATTTQCPYWQQQGTKSYGVQHGYEYAEACHFLQSSLGGQAYITLQQPDSIVFQDGPWQGHELNTLVQWLQTVSDTKITQSRLYFRTFRGIAIAQDEAHWQDIYESIQAASSPPLSTDVV